jgi:hypothetical protein
MRHRRERRFRILPMRRCLCGHSWPCPDENRYPEGTPVPDGQSALATNRSLWIEQTAAHPKSAGPDGSRCRRPDGGQA